MVQVYTGNGKGKTTAAIGLSVRAACAGMRVYFGQFMKGREYSELSLPKHFPGRLVLEQYGTPKLLCRGEPPSNDDLERAEDGLRRIGDAMTSGRYDIVVADELNVAVHLGLIDESRALEVITRRPEDVELVITGRYAPSSFIEAADLVTEMRNIKHYYDTIGLKAREGIEF